MSDFKTLLCCIVKQENKYIREFVEYYKNIGITHIVVYDNNDLDGEHLDDVIGDYIDDGFVNVIDCRGKKCYQMPAYTEAYEIYGKSYDWLLFFDVDEFFWSKYDSIGDFLSLNLFRGFDAILINWRVYTDNNDPYYREGNVIDRFPTPMNDDVCCEYDFPENNHVKTIIRGGLNNIMFGNPHCTRNVIRCCNTNGVPVRNYPFTKYVHDNAYLKHYNTKTAEEYAHKLKRGFCDLNRPNYEPLLQRNFFHINEVTPEKIEVFKRELGVDVSYLLKK